VPQPDPSIPGLSVLLELAVEAATAAGAVLMAGVGQTRRTVETKSSSTDMVTEMDRAAELVVVQVLRQHRPDDAILAEEGADSSGTSTVRWVVDPLDGTTNYLYGRPEFAVSVAAEVGGRPAVGVVHDPSRAETFTAVAGRGSWLNGVSLHLPAPPPLAQALVGTGSTTTPTGGPSRPGPITRANTRRRLSSHPSRILGDRGSTGQRCRHDSRSLDGESTGFHQLRL